MLCNSFGFFLRFSDPGGLLFNGPHFLLFFLSDPLFFLLGSLPLDQSFLSSDSVSVFLRGDSGSFSCDPCGNLGSMLLCGSSDGFFTLGCALFFSFLSGNLGCLSLSCDSGFLLLGFNTGLFGSLSLDSGGFGLCGDSGLLFLLSDSHSL